MKCWEEEPGNRPSFTHLKTTMNTFMQTNSSDIFLDPDRHRHVFRNFQPPAAGYDRLEPIENTLQSLDDKSHTHNLEVRMEPGYHMPAPPESYIQPLESSTQQEFSAPGTRARDHALEMECLEGAGSLEEEERSLEVEGREDSCGGDSSKNLLKECHSDPYISTVKRDLKQETRRSFKWRLETRLIRIQPISRDGED